MKLRYIIKTGLATFTPPPSLSLSLSLSLTTIHFAMSLPMFQFLQCPPSATQCDKNTLHKIKNDLPFFFIFLSYGEHF
jgi:hypothetical protein